MARNTKEETAAEETTPVEAEAKETKSKKAPLPEGYETPVQFAKRFTGKDGEQLKPQIMYGYLKNGKDFPAEKNSDGHFMVNVEKGLEWMAAHQAKQAERAAAREAKAAAKAEAPTPAE